MVAITNRLRDLVHTAEKRWDGTRRSIKHRLGWTEPAIVEAYRGFGTSERIWLKGRVLEQSGGATKLNPSSFLSNLRYTAKRYETDEVPGAVVNWRFGSQSGTLTADDEGYVELSFEPGPEFDPEAGWQTVPLTVLEAGPMPPLEIVSPARVRTPSEHAAFGIISDVDDTIIKTGAFDFTKHWRIQISYSADARLVMPGTTPLYRGLAKGAAGPETNPFFYVSSGPWNLYDLLERFMALNEIPLGPILLKDYGLTATKWLSGGHHDHKSESIERILETYRDLPFILIGDSGQRDAKIYADIVRRHPDRIAAVFIRDVHHGQAAEIEALGALLAERDIPFAHTADLAEAASIALSKGWIDQSDRDAVDAAIAAIADDERYWLHRHDGTDH